MDEPPKATERIVPAAGSEAVSLIAHRGYGGVYPENTRTAFEHATGLAGEASTADMVELDVMPTADGEVVVFHDAELDRLTDATDGLRNRRVWETSYATLSELDVLESGETIPRLADVLDLVPPEVGVNVEFKNPGSDAVEFGALDGGALDRERRRWRGFAERVLDIASDYPHDVLVSSLAEGAIAAVRDVDPGVPVAFAFWDSVADGMAVARRHDCEAIHLPRNMVYGTAMFNDDYVTPTPFEAVDLVEVAHAEGRRINVWTVDDPFHATELARAGVDGILVDYPGLLAGSRLAATAKPTQSG